MKEWTREERYRMLDPKNSIELEKLHGRISLSPWRSYYHIQTVTGLLNDPNGFSYFNGKWHLFYQWFPYGAVHGEKHWYHVESEDLVHWKNLGIGLMPDSYEDNKGCYSGCGYVKGDTLYLVYTGNHRDDQWIRHPYQLIQKMDVNGNFTRAEKPIITEQKGYTEHQRDPKLLFNESDGYYYILLGAQREDKTGTLLLYRSKEIETGWNFYGELKIQGMENIGYMAECPDLEKVGDQWLLLFSPQGLQPNGDEFQNKFNNTYFVGNMDFENCVFTPVDGKLRELDRGFDFYAAQCAYQNQYPNQAILIGWFGCADYTYPPTDEEGYEGLLTLPRVLSIEGSSLKIRPVQNLAKIKGDQLVTGSGSWKIPEAAVYEIAGDDQAVKINLWKSKDSDGLVISYDPESKYLVLDKSALQNQTNDEFGTQRKVLLENGLRQLLIFQDRSSVEIFVNDGDAVLSVRVFPNQEEDILTIETNADCGVFQANRTVEDNFIIWREN